MMIVEAIAMASDSRICCVIIKLKLIMQFKLNLYFFLAFFSVVNKIFENNFFSRSFPNSQHFFSLVLSEIVFIL